MHDKASPHKARSTQNFLAAADVRVVKDWPSNSPDLNPIENLWSWMQRRVSQAHPTDLEALTAAVMQAWDEVPASLLQELATSKAKRLGLVEERGGGYTGY